MIHAHRLRVQVMGYAYQIPQRVIIHAFVYPELMGRLAVLVKKIFSLLKMKNFFKNGYHLTGHLILIKSILIIFR